MLGRASCVGAGPGITAMPANSACAASDIHLDAAGSRITSAISATAKSTGKAKNPGLKRSKKLFLFLPDLSNEPCMDASLCGDVPRRDLAQGARDECELLHMGLDQLFLNPVRTGKHPASSFETHRGACH